MKSKMKLAVRMHLYLSDHQKQWLNHMAYTTHRTISDVIRQCIFEHPEYRAYYTLDTPSPTIYSDTVEHYPGYPPIEIVGVVDTPEDIADQKRFYTEVEANKEYMPAPSSASLVEPPPPPRPLTYREQDEALVIAIDAAIAEGQPQEVIDELTARRPALWAKIEEEEEE